MWRFLLAVLLFAATAVRADETDEVSLGDYSDMVRKAVLGKIREALAERPAADSLAGTVTLSGSDAFYLQGKEDSLKVVFGRSVTPPKAGDTVLAEGRPSLEGGRVVFVAEKWRKTGTAELPAPRKATAEDLVFVAETPSGRARDVNWRRVEISGRAIGLTDNGFAIEVDSMPVTVLCANLPDFLDDCGAMRPKVTVTGVAELILDESTLFGRNRYVMGVKLLVGAASDIVLVPDAVYLLNRKDRSMQLAVVAAFVGLGLLLVALIVFSLRQARRHLATRTLMAERKRMADDLHDTIEQHLVGAGMLLQLQKTKEAREILLRAKREMRDIVWGLKNDDMMRLSPSEMLRELAREETRKGICRVEAKLQGLPDHMDAASMRDLSLIVREAIGNAVKHGNAKKIAISCDPTADGGWLVRIANDGAPFDPATAPGAKEGHFGVEGMRGRGRRLGAELSFSTKGDWTVLSIRKGGQ